MLLYSTHIKCLVIQALPVCVATLAATNKSNTTPTIIKYKYRKGLGLLIKYTINNFSIIACNPNSEKSNTFFPNNKMNKFLIIHYKKQLVFYSSRNI